jgi:hypothetical protein
MGAIRTIALRMWCWPASQRFAVLKQRWEAKHGQQN